jgi:hypothetical protein
VASSRRDGGARDPAAGSTAARTGPEQAASAGRATRRLPPVRLAPREELAAAARVAPLLRAARDLSAWSAGQPGIAADRELPRGLAAQAAAAADTTGREIAAAWQVVVAAAPLAPAMSGTGVPDIGAVLAAGTPAEVLALWDGALLVILDREDLDAIATALYTVGGPVGMDGLFDAYAAAAGSARSRGEGPAGASRDQPADEAAALSQALETLADLGVVELGTDDSGRSLTVALSPLGVWGVHRWLRAQGWHAPVLGDAAAARAEALLATLASCDAEDGEAEIDAWLATREPAAAAAELIEAAAAGSPGLRGAAFAVLDRIGGAASGQVRAALPNPVLRAHAAVWLLEHGEDAELLPEDRTWLLVDLGAGLLEEADPQDVVAELLPDLPGHAQAEIVASLWQVSHPGVTGLLMALIEHHPDPAVVRAARKASFRARSRASGSLRSS